MTNSWNRSDIEKHFNNAKTEGWLPFFAAASVKHEVKLHVLLAIASRETGMKNELGDHGHGRGIMQIDDRSHGTFLANHADGMDPESNIDCGAQILKENLNVFGGDYHKACAAYNCGAGGVKRALRENQPIDFHTAGGDYGQDVLNRAEVMAELLAAEVG